MTTLRVLQGDITTVAVDAVVNAASSAMRGGGGVDGAIHAAGGPTILAECIERFPDGLPSGAPNPFGTLPPSTQPNTSAIVLTVLSGVATLTVYCACIGLPSLIFGILGITKQSTDPEGAARMTKIGWIVFGVMTLLTVLAIAGFIAVAVMSESSSPLYPTY